MSVIKQTREELLLKGIITYLSQHHVSLYSSPLPFLSPNCGTTDETSMAPPSLSLYFIHHGIVGIEKMMLMFARMPGIESLDLLLGLHFITKMKKNPSEN